MNNNLTVNDSASMLLGAGLTQINTDLFVAMILIGVGVFLKVLVATLHKQGIEVSAPQLG